MTNEAREALARDYLHAVCDRPLIAHDIPRTPHQSHACIVPGASKERIIVGAHYDHFGPGRGVVDNWTGVVMAAKLAERFSAVTPQYTWEFVLFGEEEPGMIGSKAYLRDHDHVRDIVAMVNLDTFGIGPVVIDRRSDRELACLADNIAGRLVIETRSNLLRESYSDWLPFQKRRIPILNLHALDRAGLRLIHTRRDHAAAVDHAHLQQSWQLALNVVMNLDEGLARLALK